jgi:hypothetical protein
MAKVAKILSPIGAIFGGMSKPAPAPVVEAPKTMPVPDADDEAAKKNRRRRMAEVAGRGGRASTILSNASAGNQLGA